MSRCRKEKRILIMILLLLLLCTGCFSNYNKGTYDLYLIPDQYEGVIRVLYNTESAPPLEREGKYDIIPVGEDGTYHTSNPQWDDGEVIDQYYYVDLEGNRKEIDRYCVSNRGWRKWSVNGIETIFTEIEVTHSQCGEEFFLRGSSM